MTNFEDDIPSCPACFDDALDVNIIATPPLWLKPAAAVKMSSLARYEIDDIIKRKLVKVVWRRSLTGNLKPLIHGPSLWSYLNSLAEPAVPPANEEGVR